ncbi:antitoxin MazE-like protein [Arthrobacter sp. HS15c]|uniref:antitoxin MazE-like protein n=1 Tax=Arthrobacter sp. HS15c TaxID=3230279 RepID=UPI003466D6AC
MSVRDRVACHRLAMRERGFRQIQMWVLDARRNSGVKRAGKLWQLSPLTAPVTTRISLSRFRKTGRSEPRRVVQGFRLMRSRAA